MAPHHIAKDDLEFYVLDRLAESDAWSVEEHLLVWEECRTGWRGPPSGTAAVRQGRTS